MSSDTESEGQSRVTPRYAVIKPYAARVLLARLKDAGFTSAAARSHVLFLRSAGYAALAVEVDEAWRQLGAAAADELAHAQMLDPGVTSDDGSAEVEVAEVPEDSESEVTTATAAAMLQCSTRWITQLAKQGKLDSRKVGKSLLLTRDQVESLRQLRKTA
jgi:excisionase family DNA binding protein